MKKIKYDSPILIENLKNNTTTRVYIDINKIFHKIVIKRRRPCFSNDSKISNKDNYFPNINNTNDYSLLSPNTLTYKSKNKIDNYSSTSTTHNIITNPEIKKKLLDQNKILLSKNNSFSKLNKYSNTFINILSPNQPVDHQYISNNKYYSTLSERNLPEKTQKIIKDLRKIFSYNQLPGKEEYKFKFDKPKSYLRKFFLCSNIYNDDDNLYGHSSSSNLLLPTCPKHYRKIGKKEVNKIKDIFKRNYESNKEYKKIIKMKLSNNNNFIKNKNKEINYKY